MHNLFASVPSDLHAEVTETLWEFHGVRIERIVSQGHASPDGFWYDQTEDEWIVVLKGYARLRLAANDEPVVMGPGDSLHIPAHQRHRVEWTSADEPTIWLAVWWRPT